jgi:hypothetical protein
MTEELLHTDGNELAGALSEMFVMDTTTMPCRCASCGRVSELARHRVYHGAGLVARCPGCDAVVARIGVFEGTMTVMWTGVVSPPRPL